MLVKYWWSINLVKYITLNSVYYDILTIYTCILPVKLNTNQKNYMEKFKKMYKKVTIITIYQLSLCRY